MGQALALALGKRSSEALEVQPHAPHPRCEPRARGLALARQWCAALGHPPPVALELDLALALELALGLLVERSGQALGLGRAGQPLLPRPLALVLALALGTVLELTPLVCGRACDIGPLPLALGMALVVAGQRKLAWRPLLEQALGMALEQALGWARRRLWSARMVCKCCKYRTVRMPLSMPKR